MPCAAAENASRKRWPSTSAASCEARSRVMSCITTTAPSSEPSGARSGSPLHSTEREGWPAARITISASCTCSPDSARTSGIWSVLSGVLPSAWNRSKCRAHCACGTLAGSRPCQARAWRLNWPSWPCASQVTTASGMDSSRRSRVCSRASAWCSTLRVSSAPVSARGQPQQALALGLGELAWDCVDDAQRAVDMAAAAHQRRAGVEAHVRLAQHQRVVHEARIGAQVGHFQQPAVLQRVRAQRHVPGRLRQAQADARLEPLPLLVDQADQRDRRLAQAGGEPGQIIEHRLGRVSSTCSARKRPVDRVRAGASAWQDRRVRTCERLVEDRPARRRPRGIIGPARPVRNTARCSLPAAAACRGERGRTCLNVRTGRPGAAPHRPTADPGLAGLGAQAMCCCSIGNGLCRTAGCLRGAGLFRLAAGFSP